MTFKKWLENIVFQDVIPLFRGIGQPNNLDRLGRWWTTNPYYALRYAGIKEGQFFVAQISKQELEQGLQNGMIKDASQDEYPNYIFAQSDPPGARPATAQEITQLRILSGDLDQNGQEIPPEPRVGIMPSVRIFRQLHNQDAINAGYKVFG
jgi:hypothetical protein